MKEFNPGKKIELAIVSASSSHANEQIVPAIIKDGRARIDYASSRNTQKLHDFANRWGVRNTTSDYKDILKSMVDGLVLVATPLIQNEMALEALKKSGSVFVEKQPAMNRSDMEKIVQVSSDNPSTPTLIDYNFIYTRLN